MTTAANDIATALPESVFSRAGTWLSSGHERGRVRIAALMAFAIRVASAAIAYLTQVMLARWMGSFEYGIFVYVWVWVLILGGMAPLGTSVTMIRFLPEHRERREFALLRGLLLQSRLVTFGISTALMLCGLLGLRVFHGSLDAHYIVPAYLALFCLPLYALTDNLDGIGRANSWIATALLPPYVIRPLIILGTMAAAYASGLPMDAQTATGCAVIATWATGLVQLVLIERRLRDTIDAGPRSYATGLWFRAALPIFLISMCELILQNADVVVLMRYVTSSEVGVYYAALKTISLIAFVHYAVGSAVAGQLAALNARGDRRGLEEAIRDAARWTFWPSLLAAVALLAGGKLFLSLFGPEFETGYPAMFVLVVGLLVRASMGPAEFVLRMLGAQQYCAAIFVASAAADVALNFVLIPRYGMLGAAAATSLSLATAAIAFYVVGRMVLGLHISIWTRPRV